MARLRHAGGALRPPGEGGAAARGGLTSRRESVRCAGRILPLRRRGLSRGGWRAAVEEALAAVGLTGQAPLHPWRLSGGTQQRVAIARALACHPLLLLVDEPFGSVDAQGREGLEDLLPAVRDRHRMTVAPATHDIDGSVCLGGRILMLKAPPGRVVAELPVPLPSEWGQIGTRALPGSVSLRATVGRTVRDGRCPGVG
ncbi:ATP-binding cassette domain-containing protein [Streptomyces ferralitis]|uniref:ATP-binding cassette domain-containing protein n=1 Tax=Streptantibioticus ferralitis TaxID=236510 RepID=A0ABT5YXF7_9ACTN|nr:ATP-binding cassette domain-containing protein [Streptantibioticus ferralitis]